MCQCKSVPQKRPCVGKLSLAEIRRMRNLCVSEGGREAKNQIGRGPGQAELVTCA